MTLKYLGIHPDERELLISGVCGICFDKLFEEDEVPEDAEFYHENIGDRDE